MADDTLDRVIAVIVETLETDDQITPDSAIKRDLGADSLALIELSMAIEDEFGIEIDDDEWAHVVTVGDAVKLVDRHCAAVKAVLQ